MRTILLVGEYHDDPRPKHFLVSQLEHLKQIGFDTMVLEGINPHLIPQLKKSPGDPDGTLLDSYQKIYESCARYNVVMCGAEQSEMRGLIQQGIHPAHPIVMTIREQAFLSQIRSITNGNVIFLTGAGHLTSMAASLRETGWNVLVAAILPANAPTEAIEHFTRGLSPHEMMFCFPGCDIAKPIPQLFIDLLFALSAPILTKMKTGGPEQAYPDSRRHLVSLYYKLSLLHSIEHAELQKAFYMLEYNIGSLYARERNYPEAIKFTTLSLTRRKSLAETPEVISQASKKLDQLKEQGSIRSAAVKRAAFLASPSVEQAQDVQPVDSASASAEASYLTTTSI